MADREGGKQFFPLSEGGRKKFRDEDNKSLEEKARPLHTHTIVIGSKNIFRPGCR